MNIPFITPAINNIIAGLPKLLNPALNVTNTVNLLISDAHLFLNAFGGGSPAWGIFAPVTSAPAIAQKSTLLGTVRGLLGVPPSKTAGMTQLLAPDSIVAFDLKKEWNIARYPMEEGAFQSYNKVKEPYDIRLTMTKGGDTTEHKIFLGILDTLAVSTGLVNVITPDAAYTNGNVYHYDMHRTSTNGVGLLTVNVYVAEIRVDVAPATAPVSVPTAASSVATTVQGRIPTPAETTALSTKAFNDWAALHPGMKNPFVIQ